MKTQINGKDADWPLAVSIKFTELMAERPVLIINANYFTSRPYVDEYNRGRKGHGFVYTTVVEPGDKSVCFVNLTGSDLI